jgi:hypothetical protein
LREFVSSIPPALEKVVLHTLEKSPQDRPANAAEFRKELVATAERLGLENAALTSSPDLAALRSVGTESPSGRLVIDISRLRENRAVNPDHSEVTLLSSAPIGRSNGENSLAPAAKSYFPRVSVSVSGSEKSKKHLKIIAVVVVALLVVVTLAIRSRNAVAPADAALASASPSPTVEPSPSPSPAVIPKREPRKPVVRPKKQSKGRSFVNKVKRIFKNPF